MKKSIIILLLVCLVSNLGIAQDYINGEVTFLSKSEKTITLNASGFAGKKKYVAAQAHRAAFNSLFNIGVAGYNDGEPLVTAQAKLKHSKYFDRFFRENRYGMFTKSCINVGEPIKVGKSYKATVTVTIYINALKRDLEAYNVIVKKKEKDLAEVAEEIQMPTIMVIPYKRDGDSYKNILQNDFDRRIAVATVQEGFNQKGVNTIDFEAKVNAAMRSANFEMNDAQSVDKQLLRNSGSDVYVTVDVRKDFAANGNRVALILKAYETSTGNVLANKQNWSPRFRTTQMDKLSSLAIKIILDDFLAQVNANFQKKASNGNTIVLNVSIASDASTDMDSELGNDQLPLSDLLRLWVKKNAHKGRYHVQGAVAESIIFDQIQIPANDSNGNPYSVSDFAFNLWEYLRSDVGIACRKRVDGNTIYITIQE
ncbi:MAG: DUF6175 family protein [Marinifilaceae bacterium]